MDWSPQCHPAVSYGLRPTPLAAQLRGAAETLAADIEGGEYSELEPDQRYSLRALSMTLASWADLVETMEIERLPPSGRGSRLKNPLVAFLVWLLRV